jgi:hypothetical protein
MSLTLSPSFLEIILNGLSTLSILRALMNLRSTPDAARETICKVNKSMSY